MICDNKNVSIETSKSFKIIFLSVQYKNRYHYTIQIFKLPKVQNFLKTRITVAPEVEVKTTSGKGKNTKVLSFHLFHAIIA